MSPSTYSEYHVPDTAPLADLKAPTPPPLAAAPTIDFWNETQWKVLLSLLDAAVPSIVDESEVTNKFDQHKLSQSQYSSAAAKAQTSVQMKPSSKLFKAYLQERALDNPAFVDNLKRTLNNLPGKLKNDLGGVLSLLSSKAGALVLTGYCTPVQEQPIHIREAIIASWLKSWMGTLRGLGKSITMVAQVAYLEASPLFKEITGYPDVPVDWKAGPHFEYTFLQFPAADEPAVIDTDVVIVGSGCGGAVAAKTLAEAGHRVVVVDKGYYFPPSQLPMPQEEATRYMYENGGFVATENNSVSAVAGACWGGGGAVNWAVCLQTQGFVRREWARKDGLTFFETQEFQDSLDRVCDFMGATDEGLRHSHKARVLLDGARKLGWHAKTTPHNSGGKEHYCGHCHLGCGSAEKQGTVVSWLPAAQRAGAQFIEGFHADRVVFDEGGTRATGVVGRWTSRDGKGGVSGPLSERRTREVEIRAKKVIVSSGTMWSPLLLMKSGIKNRNLGQNLHIHPCNFVNAYYEEETRPWEGAPITAVCTSFENLDGQGHGVKLEPTCMLPYAAWSWIPWRSGLNFKLAVMRYRHAASFISMARDRDTGSVFPDPVTGRPRINYSPSAFDSAHMLEGCIAIAKMCYITGATEITVQTPGVEPFVRGANHGSADKDGDLGVTDPAFEKWIEHVRRVGNAAPDTMISSAHQMGTCRMSSHAGAGVVDPKGKVWGREALYVADASVFPSASGVNPMVTNMAIVDHIARGVARELDAEK